MVSRDALHSTGCYRISWDGDSWALLKIDAHVQKSYIANDGHCTTCATLSRKTSRNFRLRPQAIVSCHIFGSNASVDVGCNVHSSIATLQEVVT